MSLHNAEAPVTRKIPPQSWGSSTETPAAITAEDDTLGIGALRVSNSGEAKADSNRFNKDSRHECQSPLANYPDWLLEDVPLGNPNMNLPSERRFIDQVTEEQIFGRYEAKLRESRKRKRLARQDTFWTPRKRKALIDPEDEHIVMVLKTLDGQKTKFEFLIDRKSVV